MSNNKQSSVEWMITQLQRSKDWHRVLNEIIQMSSARVDIIEQAKAMHKEEIMNARRNGSYKVTEKYGEVRTNIKYYNETFEK
jgi:alkylated DNA nucleotide flippase Atl1